jgi:glycosyltransferase involved in cell wall biosynthesis
MSTQNTDIKNTAPLVSVAMCTYNGEAYLKEQLDCIIQQTYHHLEIVIVDDGSTDGTVQLLEAYRLKDNRIKFYQNEINLGYNKNFEKAFHLTTGNYIAIADQDDVWVLNKIETLLTLWKGIGIFAYSISMDFEGLAPIGENGIKPIRYYEGSMPEKLAFDSPVHGHACIFHRSLLQKASPFPENVFYDWWLSMVASATDKVVCIKETLTYHRIYNANSSRTLLDMKDKNERISKIRQQCIIHMEKFLSRKFAAKNTTRIIEKYTALLRRKKNNRFSFSLFSFFFKYRPITFHYKRKQNIFSLVKNSFKKAFTGL